ncbi:60S ribosomal protein L28-like protein [Cricetulus griseus]|nr:60S ribosomal protein L28-like protein [Cricetulus griseus]
MPALLQAFGSMNSGKQQETLPYKERRNSMGTENACALLPVMESTGVRNGSSFLIKWNKQKYRTRTSNLKAGNSCYNGLINRKTVGVEPAAEGKGVVVVMRDWV